MNDILEVDVVPIVNSIRWQLIENRAMLLCKLIGTVIDLLRSRATLEAEILMLRQQINVLRRANLRDFDLRRLTG